MNQYDSPSRSGKEVKSPSPPPLRTVQAPCDAYGSSIGQRTLRHAVGLHEKLTSTLLGGSQQRNRRRSHQQEFCTPPTELLYLLKSVCHTFHVDQHQREVCRLSPWDDVAARLKPYPTHYRSAFACSLLLYPPPHQCLLRGPLPWDTYWSLGRRRAYHVPPLSPCGLGRASPPVVRQLRTVSSKHRNLTTYLLVPVRTASCTGSW
jgi:hypothetical protein